MEEKQFHTYYIFACAFFICLLLSFSVYYITESLFTGDSNIADRCYDGSNIPQSDPLSRFLRTTYQSKKNLSRVRRYEYELFGIVNNGNVIAGKENFLFEIKDAETGYDYLEDYIGQCAFTDEECAAILAELLRRKAEYEALGSEYLLVILPNAQTVYSEYMPPFLNNMKRDTRMTRLCAYLDEQGFDSYADLTEELIEAKSAGLLYNNTENSLNALGIYYTYWGVYNRFSDRVRATAPPIRKESLSFWQNNTSGKAIAKRAGIEDAVLNRTVSLSNSTVIRYNYLMNTGGITKTSLKPAAAQGQDTSLLLQFSNNWEKLQSEPFFSNTFNRVTYQSGLHYDEYIYKEAAPRAVIQFIYEYELEQLLPGAALPGENGG